MHRVFQPSAAEPLDFERTVEDLLLALRTQFHIIKILYDPYQMQATAQRLQRAGLPIEEFPQTVPNLTAASRKSLRADPGGKSRNLSRRRHAACYISCCCGRDTDEAGALRKRNSRTRLTSSSPWRWLVHAAVEGQASAPMRIPPEVLMRLASMGPYRRLIGDGRG